MTFLNSKVGSIIVFLITISLGIGGLYFSNLQQSKSQKSPTQPAKTAESHPGDPCGVTGGWCDPDGAGPEPGYWNCQGHGANIDPSCNCLSNKGEPEAIGLVEVPSPTLNCISLGPQPTNPKPGQKLTFTCSASAKNTTINHYNFRVNNGTPVKVTSEEDETKFTYTVPAKGDDFIVQCQVCTSADNSHCTSWGQAN